MYAETMDFSVHRVALFLFILMVMIDQVWSLPEPFDLKFGPDEAGDQWVEKNDDTCPRFDLNGPLHYDNVTIESFEACEDYEVRLIQAGGVVSSLIYLAEMDGDTLDTVLDRMCLTSAYYETSGYNQDYICEWYLEYDTGSDEYYPTVTDYADYYVYDPFQFEKAYEWDSISFLRKNVDIYFDDQMTMILTGADTKYVNLVDNLFVRNISSQQDRDIINARIGNDFSVDFGFVVTFYKARKYNHMIGHSNSLQFIVACDDKNTSEITDNKCYSMTQYQQLDYDEDYSGELEASFNLDEGEVELPFDYEDALAKKLMTSSNVGMPGLWIYEINQGYEEPFLRIPPHLVNYCKGAYLKPSSVPLYSGPESLPEVKIECTGVIGGNQDVVVKLIGSSFNKSIDAEYNYDEVKVIIPVPVFWGVDEVAQISMTVEGMPEKKIDATISFKPELVDGPLQIEHRSNNEIEVTWPSVTLNETTSFFVNQFTYNGTQIGYEHVDDTEITLIPGNTSFFYKLENIDVVRFELDSNQGKFVSIVAKKNETDCVDWIHDQLDRDLAECGAVVEALHGCPIDPSFDDSFWAHEEVNYGPLGWFYDPCCNQDVNMPSKPDGVCNARNCDFNPGAQFCIRSPSVPCYDIYSDQTIYASNQCCYSELGNLIDNEREGAGRMSLSKASMGNLHHFLKNELEPYHSCCQDDIRCDLFHQNRPTLTGSYTGSLTVPVTFGGHFQTGDGIDYNFLGLGVYTLLETDLEIQTTVQITTRVIGDLTVVAGIAISYGDLKVEIMRPYVVPTGKTSRIRNLYFVNGDMVFTDLFVIGPEDPFDLYFRGINLKQEAGGRSLHVWIPGANLCVNIFMARNYLNLYLTLPDSFRGHTRGLVGLFDGRLDNDFKPIAQLIDPLRQPVEPTSLHMNFAESWRVLDSQEWIFGEFLSEMILAEISSGPVSYNYSIPSEETDVYDGICNGDLKCEEDVVRSGDAEFAAEYEILRDRNIRGSNTARINELNRNSFKSDARKNMFRPMLSIMLMIFATNFVI